MLKTKASVCLAVLVLAVGARAQGQAPAPATGSGGTSAVFPLWGDLAAGPYRVGFRAVFRFDRSRTWKSTRDFKGAFSPDLQGRPVQLCGEKEVASCIDANRFNTWGYNLLGQNRPKDALPVFQRSCPKNMHASKNSANVIRGQVKGSTRRVLERFPISA